MILPNRTSVQMSEGRLGLPTREEIRRRLISAVARVRAIEAAEIEVEIEAGGGDLQVKSKVGVTAVSILEGELGCELPGPEDLEPAQLTSLEALTSLIHRKLQERA